ncbi:MAG: hypothetical protein JWN99_1175 [Ilumatobacteraceae bacterium]|nr:hypothetical protein [Ilumatobacteraceae bacterium]
MSYLGYDRDLLAALRRAVRRSSDQLATFGNTDVEAADAISTLLSSRAALDDQWLPLLDGLLGCIALEGRTPARLDPSDLRLAVMFDRQESGWLIVNDPLDDVLSDTVTADEARSIGERLLDAEAVDELTTDELVWLAGRLNVIEGNPAAMKAFRSAFSGDDDWAPILDRLGLDRAAQANRSTWDPDDRVAVGRLTQLDAVIAPLARLYAAGPHTSHAGPWYPTVIDRLDPYSAALLLRELDLDPNAAAAAAEDVLLRWMTGHDDDRAWTDQFLAGDNSADLLFEWLALDSAAASAFIVRAAAHPEIVFGTTHEDASVQALMAAGTAPTVMSIESAGIAIPPLLTWAVDHESTLSAGSDGGVDQIRSILATAVGPWLMQLTSRSTDWSWSPDDADAALLWIIEDQAAAARLVAAMEGWQVVLANTRLIGSDGLIPPAVDDLIEMFAVLQTRLHGEEVDDATHVNALSAMFVQFGELLASAVPGGMVASVLVDLTLTAVNPVAKLWLQKGGLLIDPQDGIDEANARFGDRSAATQVIALVSTVGRFIDAGALPAEALAGLNLDDLDDTCTPDAVTDRLHAFVDGLPDSTDVVTRLALANVVSAFGNHLSAAQQCAA